MSSGDWFNRAPIYSPCCGENAHVQSKKPNGVRYLRCVQCGKQFPDHASGKKRSNGSGVIAGKITIGRGTRWWV